MPLQEIVYTFYFNMNKAQKLHEMTKKNNLSVKMDDNVSVALGLELISPQIVLFFSLFNNKF